MHGWVLGGLGPERKIKTANYELIGLSESPCQIDLRLFACKTRAKQLHVYVSRNYAHMLFLVG
jgi:hypothetical protein